MQIPSYSSEPSLMAPFKGGTFYNSSTAIVNPAVFLPGNSSSLNDTNEGFKIFSHFSSHDDYSPSILFKSPMLYLQQ
jgi:hypothetical protein